MLGGTRNFNAWTRERRSIAPSIESMAWGGGDGGDGWGYGLGCSACKGEGVSYGLGLLYNRAGLERDESIANVVNLSDLVHRHEKSTNSLYFAATELHGGHRWKWSRIWLIGNQFKSEPLSLLAERVFDCGFRLHRHLGHRKADLLLFTISLPSRCN